MKNDSFRNKNFCFDNITIFLLFIIDLGSNICLSCKKVHNCCKLNLSFYYFVVVTVHVLLQGSILKNIIHKKPQQKHKK